MWRGCVTLYVCNPAQQRAARQHDTARANACAWRPGCGTPRAAVRGTLQAVRLHWLIMVREKARVHLPQGAFLYGALDETGTLDVGQVGWCVCVWGARPES